jgi:hypothetical protein
MLTAVLASLLITTVWGLKTYTKVKAMELEHKASLSIWEDCNWADTRCISQVLDFREMKLRYTYSDVGVEEARLYEVKRDNTGTWFVRLTPGSLQDRIDCLKREIAKGWSYPKKELAELYANPRKWYRMADGPSVETAYQRFIRQG